jgi:hypothetical protein
MRSCTRPLVAVLGAVAGVVDVVVVVDGPATGAGTLSSASLIADRLQHVQPTLLYTYSIPTAWEWQERNYTRKLYTATEVLSEVGTQGLERKPMNKGSDGLETPAGARTVLGGPLQNSAPAPSSPPGCRI